MLCDNLDGWDEEGGREAHERGDIYIYTYMYIYIYIYILIADSHCIAETNTTLPNNYYPIKKKF